MTLCICDMYQTLMNWPISLTNEPHGQKTCPLDLQPSPKVNKTLFMLSSTEHEISTDQKNENAKNKDISCFQTLKCCVYPANKC